MMYCTTCGTPRREGALACPNCGQQAPHYAPPPPINNYLVPAILVTLCCCLPGGVVAIVYAAQVNSKLAAGDVMGAQAAARNAKMWSWISLIAGGLFGLAYAGLALLGAMGSK